MARLLTEIRELGYDGSQNLLYRYLNQGRHLDDSPRRATRLLLTRPNKLNESQTATLAAITGACHEMADLADLVHAFAALLTPDETNPAALDTWVTRVRVADLPHLHSYARGLNQDRDAVNAAQTCEFHNGRTDGVNTRTKMIKRQKYGRAGFDLLRPRILLT